MRKYYLAKDSYMCEASGHAIFLDLKRDRYLALPPEVARQLWIILPGLRMSASVPADWSEDANISIAESDELAQLLESEGLLVEDESYGKPSREIELEEVRATSRSQEEERPDVVPDHRWKFLAAWSISTAMLKLLPLKFIVGRVRARKARRVREISAAPSLEEVNRLANIYSVLQPRHFSADNACLRNSLTMIEFLSRYDVYPTWVFGVRIQPFAAHSWVQHGATVLNDSAHHVKTYTPLLAI